MLAEPPASLQPIGLYVHFPFCTARCTYCDFPTVVGGDDRIQVYLRDLEHEIGRFQTELPAQADSVFIGGGTPSRMRAEQVAGLLRALRARFDLDPGAEITLECNPEGVSDDTLRAFRETGVNRVSIGVQSLDDRVLRATGRGHGAAAARRAVEQALGTAGLAVNVDLIAGLPVEDLERWERTVDEVGSWGTDHVSVYLLETDKETPLARAVRAGRAQIADGLILARAYRQTARVLEQHGLRWYEISNFARPGGVSRHNLKYWTDCWYGGFGVGAHGYAAGRRRANVRELDRYRERISRGRDPVGHEEPWNALRRMEEAVILGLRLVEGLDLERLGRRYRVDLVRRYDSTWRRGEAAGWIEREGRHLRLTEEGRLHSNELFCEILEPRAVASRAVQ